MAKLSHLEKEYIKANYKNKSIDELTKKLEKDRELIEEYINNLQNSQKNNTKTNKKEKVNKENGGNILSKFFSKKENQEPIYKRYEIKPYHLSKIDAIFAAAAFLFTFFLYLFTLTPSLSAGDNGRAYNRCLLLGSRACSGISFLYFDVQIIYLYTFWKYCLENKFIFRYLCCNSDDFLLSYYGKSIRTK